MEKYGTDMSQLPPTDDQIREIRKIASEQGIDVVIKSQEEAREFLEKHGE